MRKKGIIVLVALLPVFLAAFTIERSSSGAPSSHTGAPGEQTCATSGCHDDNVANTGTASIKIDLGTATNYVAGKKYTIKVSVSDNNVNRFGFQLVALNNQSMNVGTFVITDQARTQIMKNDHNFKDRDYVTYTFNGTDATSSGMSEWMVDWIAPSSSSGPVTFYAAGVSANDDMSDKGDYTYTTSKVLNN